MRHISHSEAGFDHINEDALAVVRHPRAHDSLICVLADGQGGQFGGGAAAQLAVRTCAKLAAEHEAAELLQNTTWREILRRVDETVEATAEAGFTTLIGLCVTPGQICGASCGDSAALLVDAENMVELSANQRKNPPLGSGRATPVAFAAPNSPDAQILSLSDGVWKFVGFEAIRAAAGSERGIDLVLQLRQLQLEANNGKLPDDFSIIVAFQ